MLDLRADFGRNSVWVPLGGSQIGQLGQIFDWSLARGCEFFRVLISQLTHAKITLVGNFECSLDRIWDSSKCCLSLLDRLQVSLGVGQQQALGGFDSGMVFDGC